MGFEPAFSDPLWIDLDEFRIVGITRRSRAGLLWIYLHRQSERELFVSEAGDTYYLLPFSTDRIRGRFEPCPIEMAIADELGAFLNPPGSLTGIPIEKLKEFGLWREAA